MNRAAGGKKRVGTGNHLVARLQVERHECEQQRIGAGGTADRLVRVAIRGHFEFKLGDFVPQHKLLCGKNLSDFFADFGGNRGVLRDEIDEGDRLGNSVAVRA